MKNIKTNIGLVGLGIIGSSIFRNINLTNYQSQGFDIDKSCMDKFNSEGLKTTSSIDELIENTSILITSLPSNQALDETIFAILSNDNSNVEAIIETSTLSPECKLRNEKKVSDHGIMMLDCPISGTGKQAETGDIVLYASGSKELYESVLPILKAFSREAFYMGKFGNGTKVKLIANLLVSIHNVASAEAIRLGLESGLDLNKLYDVIASGAGTSKIFELRAPMMIEGDYLPATMKMDVWKKDLKLIREMVNSYDIDSPLFKLTDDLYKEAEDYELEHLDTDSIYELLKKKY